MILIDNGGHTDPRINLALEEYVLRNFSATDDYLLFYINEPSIIIGRNQNTVEEVNSQYVGEKNIHVVRRVSGGGAVYHDLGNLNFSFITDHDGKSLNNFKKFTAPVIKVLQDLGLDAELQGRNDILVNGKKISGTAQSSTGKRMISHGTLLFDTDLGEVANALNVKLGKIQSKGHKSVRSRVANISEFLRTPLTIEEFRIRLLNGLNMAGEPMPSYSPTSTEWEAVHQLKTEKYDTWDWNYGRSPKFNIRQAKRFPIGEIDLRIFVEKGYITDFRIFGDFFGKEPVAGLEQLMIGTRYNRESILERLEGVGLYAYFGDLPKADFIELVHE